MGVLGNVIWFGAHLVQDVEVSLKLKVEGVALIDLSRNACPKLLQGQVGVDLLRLICSLLIGHVIITIFSMTGLECQPQ